MRRMLAKRFLLLAILLVPLPAGAAGTSGLPIPRFVSLKAEEVNVRTGPGTRYPIQWIYRRQGMPVEVVEEFDYWRKIRDIEGTSGWVHKSMLDGRRHALVKGKEARTVRLAPEAAAKPLLKVEPMVTARLVECTKDWCRLQISGRKGWMEKKHLWGVYAGELLD
jgi:SH3-like domain-containing protein